MNQGKRINQGKCNNFAIKNEPKNEPKNDPKSRKIEKNENV